MPCRLVEQCNILDEVWVPSQHHIEVFARAGVDRSKLVVIPESLDTNFFHPDKVQPLPLPGFVGCGFAWALLPVCIVHQHALIVSKYAAGVSLSLF
jgi:glycosyltransferase involved in cell wall biosynthesis